MPPGAGVGAAIIGGFSVEGVGDGVEETAETFMESFCELLLHV